MTQRPSHQMLRFLIAGVLNTVFSLAVYRLLLLFMRYGFAYTIGFIAGAIASFALNTYFVFRTPWSWKKFAAFPGVQAANYVLGFTFLAILVDGLGMDERYAPLISIPATIPFNFLMSRWLMHRGIESPDHVTATPETTRVS